MPVDCVIIAWKNTFAYALAVAIDKEALCTHNNDFWMGQKVRELFSNTQQAAGVVRIHKSNVLAFCKPQSPVERNSQAIPFFVSGKAQPAVIFFALPQDFP